MQIKQFEDKNLSQFSYAIVSDCEKKVILIDPSRNAQPYLDFAKEQEAEIVAVIETHPHADFVSSHLELHQTTGATIYAGSLVEASYPHTAFDEGDTLEFGKIKLSALHTPGHSPDSISILLEHDGIQKAVFSGDTLFIGDCGRPDLREGAGKIRGTRLELAKSMYHTLRDKYLPLNDDVTLYPAHGAGTLCGKNLSKDSSSTMGKEKETNWSLQEATEEEFVNNLLADQPFVPQYFPYNVDLNRSGAAPLKETIGKVSIGEHDANSQLDKGLWVVDTRKESDFKKGHLPHSVNLMEKGKFETWLGSIIRPDEKFYLAAENKDELDAMIMRAATIGYETNIAKAFILDSGSITEDKIDVEKFKGNLEDYTIVDVRNTAEVKNDPVFENSLAIPLSEVRNRIEEIPTDKPIVVHCAGGYRSAAGSSIINSSLNGSAKVFDLGEAIKEFSNH